MMAAPSRTLKLTYLGDASQLSKSTKGAGQQIQSLGDRMKKVGKALAVGFAAVGAAGIAMGKKLFDAFEQVSTANARVSQLVDTLGNFEGQVADVTERLIGQAEATARLTGVDRNLIKESQAILLTFAQVNKTAADAGSTFDRATQAAVDLAAAGFGSVDSAANQLGKALEDPIRGLGSLREVGVSFTAEQEDLIRSLAESNQTLAAQGIILEAIEGQVGGVAEATANGSAKISQSFGILVEQIATALAPAFERLVEIGLAFVEKVAGWWDRNGEAIIQSFRDFGVAVRDLWTRFSEFVGLVKEEMGESGSFAALRETLAETRVQAGITGQAFLGLWDTIAGTDTEGKAKLFNRYLEVYIAKPLDRLFESLSGLIELFGRFASAARNVGEFLRGRGQLGIGQDSDFDMQGFTPGQTVPIPRRVVQPGRSVVVNVTGAIDPEGTARTIERVLTSSALRVGQAPTPGISAIQ